MKRDTSGPIEHPHLTKHSVNIHRITEIDRGDKEGEVVTVKNPPLKFH